MTSPEDITFQQMFNRIPVVVNDVDLAAVLTEKALATVARRRGSFSPVYDACTKLFIAELAAQIVTRAQLYERPEMRILDTASKALVVLRRALEEVSEEHPLTKD